MMRGQGTRASGVESRRRDFFGDGELHSVLRCYSTVQRMANGRLLAAVESAWDARTNAR
jgi:hypothetical protein